MEAALRGTRASGASISYSWMVLVRIPPPLVRRFMFDACESSPSPLAFLLQKTHFRGEHTLTHSRCLVCTEDAVASVHDFLHRDGTKKQKKQTDTLSDFVGTQSAPIRADQQQLWPSGNTCHLKASADWISLPLNANLTCKSLELKRLAGFSLNAKCLPSVTSLRCEMQRRH